MQETAQLSSGKEDNMHLKSYTTESKTFCLYVYSKGSKDFKTADRDLQREGCKTSAEWQQQPDLTMT